MLNASIGGGRHQTLVRSLHHQLLRECKADSPTDRPLRDAHAASSLARRSRIFINSSRRRSPVSGNCICSELKVSRTIFEMIKRAFSLSSAGTMYQAGTLSGNPVAMASGIATLDILSRPGMFEKAEWAAAEMVRLLRAWAAKHDIPFTADSAGTMWGSFFLNGNVPDYATAKGADTKRYGRVFHGLLDAGVYIAPSQFEAGFTSISHDAAVMAEVAEALERVAP